VYLSIFLLAGIAWLFRRHFSLFSSLIALLITAFTVFVFKAPWFQAELLFYFLTFGLFYLMGFFILVVIHTLRPSRKAAADHAARSILAVEDRPCP